MSAASTASGLDLNADSARRRETMANMNVEIVVESGPIGHRVVTYANGEEIHSTIHYPSEDWARMHAKDIEDRARAVIKDSAVAIKPGT